MNIHELMGVAVSWPTRQRTVQITIGSTVQLLAANPARWHWLIVPDITASIRISMDPSILATQGITVSNGTGGFEVKFWDDPGMCTQAWFGFQNTVASMNVIVIECLPIGQNNP